MPGPEQGAGGDIVIKDGLVSAGIKWLFGQDKQTILLVLILGGVGTGVYFLGSGMITGVPEWLAGIRAGYKEAITEFRLEAKEQRDDQEKERAAWQKRDDAREAKYQGLVDQLLQMKGLKNVSVEGDDSPVAASSP